MGHDHGDVAVICCVGCSSWLGSPHWTADHEPEATVDAGAMAAEEPIASISRSSSCARLHHVREWLRGHSARLRSPATDPGESASRAALGTVQSPAPLRRVSALIGWYAWPGLPGFPSVPVGV